MDKEKKDKKLPFNTFRKGIVAGILGLTLGVSAFGLAGCTDGKNGKDGTQWLSGTNTPVASYGVDGDFYFDTDDYVIYQKVNGQWVSLGSIKGENGLTPYVGYDGYMWTERERSNAKVVDVLSDNVRENTILLGGNTAFDSTEIKMGETQVALMNTYLPNIRKTLYSGVTVSEIQVYAKTAGTLTIGTAKVEDIVSRTGSVIVSEEKTFDVVAGLNTLTFTTPLSIAETDTLVLGKTGDTSSLVYYSGIETDDDQGVFANLSNMDLYSTTNSVKNKIAIKVTVSPISTAVETQEGLKAYLETSANTFGKSVVMDDAPYTIKNMTKYAGITVHHIDFGVKSITAKDANQYITVYKVKQSTVTEAKQYLSNIVGTYKFYASASNWEDVSDMSNVNKLVSFYCSESVTVGSDETLVFGNPNDPVAYTCGTNTGTNSFNGFYYTGNGGNSGATVLSINVWKTDTSTTWKEYVETLKEKEQQSIFRGHL